MGSFSTGKGFATETRRPENCAGFIVDDVRYADFVFCVHSDLMADGKVRLVFEQTDGLRWETYAPADNDGVVCVSIVKACV